MSRRKRRTFGSRRGWPKRRRRKRMAGIARSSIPSQKRNRKHRRRSLRSRSYAGRSVGPCPCLTRSSGPRTLGFAKAAAIIRTRIQLRRPTRLPSVARAQEPAEGEIHQARGGGRRSPCAGLTSQITRGTLLAPVAVSADRRNIQSQVPARGRPHGQGRRCRRAARTRRSWVLKAGHRRIRCPPRSRQSPQKTKHSIRQLSSAACKSSRLLLPRSSTPRSAH